MKSSSAPQVDPPSPTSPLRLLLLEHSQKDAAAILHELRSAGISVDPIIVHQRSDFESALSSQNFAAILAAYTLPGWTGLDAFSHLRQTGNETPFLLVTGVLSEDATAQCTQHGVNDYMLKDRLARLPVALKRALEERQLRDANAQVRFQLAESEARSREPIENSIYGIFHVSFEGSFLSPNSVLLQLLACNSLHELQSLNLATDVFRYPENFSRLLASCREHGLVHSDETEWRRRDGGLVSVRLPFRYLSLPGSADAIEGVAEDVTELRLLERQLLQAQKFESIGQLAGGAHDFNNVIGAILGWAELGYEQSRAHPVIAERFTRIREQAERAASFTRELPVFARRQTLEPRPVDLNAAFHSPATLFDKVIDKNIEIKVISANVQPVNAGPAQIEQVLMNLCLNARDAMPDGGRLSIETEMVLLDDSYCRLYPYVVPGSYAVLSVSDTGIGMDPEARERIFEPFFTTKHGGKGSGMGLATVYGIVKQHSGFIHVYSELKQGSLFRVYLPAMEVPLLAGYSSAPEASPTFNLHGTETILIAEDHDSIREMVRQTLVGLGYRVLAAADGQQALRLCETGDSRARHSRCHHAPYGWLCHGLRTPGSRSQPARSFH